MPDEPKKPIEKTLEAWARKRRDSAGGPFELHPATRRMLQSEAARKFPRPGDASAGWRQLFAAIWRRLAFGASLVAVLMLGTWALLKSPVETKSPLMLAKDEPRVEAAESESPQAQRESMSIESDGKKSELRSLAGEDATPRQKVGASALAASADTRPAPGRTPQAIGLEKEMAFSRQSSELAATKILKEANPENTVATAPADETPGLFAYRGDTARKAPAAPTAEARILGTISPSPIQQPTEIPARTLHFADVAAPAQTQNYVQTLASGQPVANGAALAASQLLQSFRVEQQGDRLRIIDQDGSAYTGFVQLATGVSERRRNQQGETAELKNATPRLAKSEADRADNEPTAEHALYFFRVSGTNRTLAQPVVFSGHFMGADGSSIAAPSGTRGGLGIAAIQETTPEQFQAPIGQLRLEGRALVGSSTELEINAIPTAR